jgi:hypothetical protein
MTASTLNFGLLIEAEELVPHLGMKNYGSSI